MRAGHSPRFERGWRAAAKWKLLTRPAAALAAFLGLMLAAGPAGGQINPVRTAPLRLRIAKIGQGDWPAKVGVAEMAPCGNAPGRFGVFTTEGKPLAFQTIWAASGELTQVCFDTSSGDTTYYICFDNELSGAAGGWKPEAGVLVETRACRADLPINNAEQVARLLNSASAPAGRDFVPNIFLGANPFGPSTYYIANFTGWFTVPSAAQYTFATASDDASSLEVDNHVVAAWYRQPRRRARPARGTQRDDCALRRGASVELPASPTERRFGGGRGLETARPRARRTDARRRPSARWRAFA